MLRYTRLSTNSNVETINIGWKSLGPFRIWVNYVQTTNSILDDYYFWSKSLKLLWMLIDHHAFHRQFGRSTELAILKLSFVLFGCLIEKPWNKNSSRRTRYVFIIFNSVNYSNLFYDHTYMYILQSSYIYIDTYVCIHM